MLTLYAHRLHGRVARLDDGPAPVHGGFDCQHPRRQAVVRAGVRVVGGNGPLQYLPQIGGGHDTGGGHAHLKPPVVGNADHAVQLQQEARVHSRRDGDALLVLHDEQQLHLGPDFLGGVLLLVHVQGGVYAHLVKLVLHHHVGVLDLQLDRLAVRAVLFAQQIEFLPHIHKVRLLGQQVRVHRSRAAERGHDGNFPARHPLVEHFHALVRHRCVFPVCHRFLPP